MAYREKLLIFASLAATTVRAELPFASPGLTPGHISPVRNGCILVPDSANSSPEVTTPETSVLLEYSYKDHITGYFLNLPKTSGRFDIDLIANKSSAETSTWNLVEDIGIRVAPKLITYGSLSVDRLNRWLLTKGKLPVTDSFIDWYDPQHELEPEVRKLMERYTHDSESTSRQGFADLTGVYSGQCLNSFPSVPYLDVYFRGNLLDKTRVYFANGILVDQNHFPGTWLYLNFLEATNWLPLEMRK